MKTFVFSWIILGVATVGAFANPGIKKNSKAKPEVSLQRQLTDQLTYPNALRKATGNGVVVIQFRLADNNTLVNPQVFSANTELNQELIQQLVHMKLVSPSGTDATEVHTARLRFMANE